MNEQMWQIACLLMWIIGIQTTLIMGALGFMWRHFDKRFEAIDKRFEGIENRLTKIEHDMIEVKTILHMKKCCMINDESQMKKVG